MPRKRYVRSAEKVFHWKACASAGTSSEPACLREGCFKLTISLIWDLRSSVDVFCTSLRTTTTKFNRTHSLVIRACPGLIQALGQENRRQSCPHRSGAAELMRAGISGNQTPR